jgi:membrane protease YdiL (CAAX protease family)
MSNIFLGAAQQGKNNWWRYLLGVLIILIFWLGLGIIFLGIFALIVFLIANPSDINSIVGSQQNFEQQLQVFLTTPSVWSYLVFNVPFLLFFLGIFVVVRSLHRRKFVTLISADASFKPQRMLSGFGVWFSLLAILTIIDYSLNSGNYEFQFEPAQWLILLPLAMVLTPIQTSAEELLFRGYLLQGLGLLTRHPLILILLNSLLFALPHFGNPEMQRGAVWLALYYFSLGAFLTLITLRDNRLELALGMHAANNLFVALLVNTKDSALPSPAIWNVNDPGDPKFSLILFWLMAVLFYSVFFVRRSPSSGA